MMAWKRLCFTATSVRNRLLIQGMGSGPGTQEDTVFYGNDHHQEALRRDIEEELTRKRREELFGADVNCASSVMEI